METFPARLIDGFRSVPPATIGHVRQTGFVDPATWAWPTTTG